MRSWRRDVSQPSGEVWCHELENGDLRPRQHARPNVVVAERAPDPATGETYRDAAVGLHPLARDVRARLGHVWKCPPGEAYYTVEGAKGEVGVYMISDGRSPNPFRAKYRGPSFVNLQILPWLLRGRLVGDVVAILGSIDIVLGDVDR